MSNNKTFNQETKDDDLLFAKIMTDKETEKEIQRFAKMAAEYFTSCGCRHVPNHCLAPDCMECIYRNLYYSIYDIIVKRYRGLNAVVSALEKNEQKKSMACIDDDIGWLERASGLGGPNYEEEKADGRQ